MENLESYGLKEIKVSEYESINGGLWQYGVALGIGLIAMGIHDAIDHPDAFFRGFVGLPLK